MSWWSWWGCIDSGEEKLDKPNDRFDPPVRVDDGEVRRASFLGAPLTLPCSLPTYLPTSSMMGSTTSWLCRWKTQIQTAEDEMMSYQDWWRMLGHWCGYLHHEHKMWMPYPMGNILFSSSKHIVNHNHFMSLYICARVSSIIHLTVLHGPSLYPWLMKTLTSSINLSTRCDPTKPAPPVTKILIRWASDSLAVGGKAFCYSKRNEDRGISVMSEGLYNDEKPWVSYSPCFLGQLYFVQQFSHRLQLELLFW